MEKENNQSTQSLKAPQPKIPLIRRGAQSKVPLQAAIIGAGTACSDLLTYLADERLARLNVEIIGVADPNPEAIGVSHAKRLGIFTTQDFTQLYSLPGLNLLIELTGSMEVRERMIRTKPLHVSSIDHRGARLLWDVIQIEAEKQQLQRESEEKLRLFLDSTHDVICIKDLEGRYQYVNPAAIEAVKIRPEEAIGKTDFQIFPSEMAAAMTARDQQVISQRTTLIFKEKMRIGDQFRHFHTVRFPILDDQGEMVALAIVSRDMTDEVILQEELRHSKEYVENILSNSSDMIVTTDLKGRIVTFNTGAERMLGYGKEEMLGVDVESLWKVPEERRRLMAEVEEKGAVNNYPAVLIRKGGREIEVSLSLSQLKDSEGRVLGTVGISKDMTEENRLRRQLIQQERLAAVGQTVAGITHCMKNVLNGLKGGSYMVNVGLNRGDSALLQEGWDNVQKGIDRISKLSMDMLSYCRERKPSPVVTDPLRLARETVELVSKSALQDGIEILVHGDEDAPVYIDPEAIGRALLNLITNAVDACREKSYPQGEKAQVNVSVARKDGKILFVVSDNGTGMSEEVCDKLFTQFFTTKESLGTGLGLCVSQKIADEHQGKITADSTFGSGSTFTIILPEISSQESTGETSKQ